MVTNRRFLLEALRLLEEIIDRINRSKISRSGQGSSRALLVRLKRLRGLLLTELKQPEPNWRGVVVPLLRDVGRWLGEFVINNFRYLLCPRVCGLQV